MYVRACGEAKLPRVQLSGVVGAPSMSCAWCSAAEDKPRVNSIASLQQQ